MGEKSDLTRAFKEDGALKTHVGGQALLEGIMMRGKYNWSVAVREPDGGVYLEEHDLASGRAGRGWMHWPLVRGCRALVESLVLGFKALEIAAEHAFAEEDEGDACGAGGEGDPGNRAVQPVGEQEEGFSWKDDFGRPDVVMDALGAQTSLEVVEGPAEDDSAGCHPERSAQREVVGSRAVSAEGDPGLTARAASFDFAASGGSAQDDKEASSSDEPAFGKGAMAVSMVFGLVLGVVLFIVAPALITNLIVGEYDQNTVLWNIVDGLLRVAVFVFYLWLIGRMSDIKRMFGYHGAEHKTIHCYEHGLPLTPENARSFPRLHVRCGTAFLIMVMLIAIFVYTVTPINGLIEAWGVPDGAPKLALVILVRILLMPVIAGISYEITVRWAGSHPENPLVKIVLWPGMQMQYLTTNEPDDGMIECAIAAMQRVLEREEAEAAKAAGTAAVEPEPASASA